MLIQDRHKLKRERLSRKIFGNALEIVHRHRSCLAVYLRTFEMWNESHHSIFTLGGLLRFGKSLKKIIFH